MAIISFDKEAVVDYVPAYAGNRESADPCVVRLKFCPYSRVQHYSRLIATRAKGAGDNLRLAEVGQEVQKRQFVENVESVANYFVDGVEVRDPERFYDTADTDLILEVIKAMESASRLSGTDKKLTAGFRLSLLSARDGSPFDCGRCGTKDRSQRNCANSLGLTEAAKAVFNYTEEVAEEIKAKGAEKVFSLRGLRLYECPLSFITWETREMIRAVYLMEGGRDLFFSGGWGDQSAWLIEAFEIFKAENAAFRKDVADGEKAG